MRSRTIGASILVLLAAALGTGTVFAHPGWGIVLDGDGQVYFTDVDRSCVWKIDARGIVREFVTGKHAHELVIDAAGNITGEHVSYDGREFHGSAWKANSEGRVTAIGPLPVSGGGFANVVDREGNAYLLSADNHRRDTSQILKRSPRGEVSVLAGGAWGYADGNGDRARFRNFGTMVMGPDGALYVTEGGNVRKVRLDGTVTTLAAGLTDDATREKPPFYGLMGLAVDDRGNVVVADYGNRQVRRITSGGVVTTIARAAWPWRPTGVALRAGEVYVLESVLAPGFLADLAGSPRVRKISKDGTVVTLASIADRAPSVQAQSMAAFSRKEP